MSLRTVQLEEECPEGGEVISQVNRQSESHIQMTLKGRCQNKEYMDLVERIVNIAEEGQYAREMQYRLTQLIIKDMAKHYTDDEILRIIQTVRKSLFLTKS